MKEDQIISLATFRHRMTIVTTSEGLQKGTQWFSNAIFTDVMYEH